MDDTLIVVWDTCHQDIGAFIIVTVWHNTFYIWSYSILICVWFVRHLYHMMSFVLKLALPHYVALSLWGLKKKKWKTICLARVKFVNSRPGQSQGLLYKHRRHWFINWVSLYMWPFTLTWFYGAAKPKWFENLIQVIEEEKTLLHRFRAF